MSLGREEKSFEIARHLVSSRGVPVRVLRGHPVAITDTFPTRKSKSLNARIFIELYCSQEDALAFSRLGFNSVCEAQSGRQRMIHACPSELVIAALVDLGLRGRNFTACVVWLDSEIGVLINPDGDRYERLPRWTTPFWSRIQ